MNKQALDELIILLILRGRVHIQISGKTYQLKADDHASWGGAVFEVPVESTIFL